IQEPHRPLPRIILPAIHSLGALVFFASDWPVFPLLVSVRAASVDLVSVFFGPEFGSDFSWILFCSYF
ncbi:hypothetical protein, partial [Leptospira ellisii]|uniref:hypothetical protein n=1 Tax=Leptospira ellisii TaxID=2023197 RepID=UPI001A9DD5F4